MAGRKCDTVPIPCPELIYENVEVEETKQPRKNRLVLNPPYNPMGMAILNSARKGMEYQGEKRAGNKRADRMQEAIVDVQRVMNLDEDEA